MIEISHLSKKYGNHQAVEDLSITIEPGKIYGFLGPNGAGKSTTMNMITGYLGASSGEIKINGFDIFTQPEEAKKCIGYLPELPPLYVDMTVMEYLNFVAELKKINKSDRKRMIMEAMEMTKILDMEQRLIRNLSKGYKQRVGLAQAILGYPDIIILDEPTVGLDPKQIIEIRDLIRTLGEKHTVILSSHILTEVKEVCDYIFIIAKGKLVANDTTRNLLESVERGVTQVEILISKDGERAKEILLKMNEVKEVSVLPLTGDDCISLVITPAIEEDIRHKVILELIAHEVMLLEVKEIGRSLEDIFLELTNQQGGEQQ